MPLMTLTMDRETYLLSEAVQSSIREKTHVHIFQEGTKTIESRNSSSEINQQYHMDLGFPDVTSGKESACQGRRHKRPKFTPLRRAWQTTPVFLTGESHGQRSLMGNSP